MRDDERALWEAFPDAYPNPRAAATALGIPRKRVEYLCEKWTRKRIYNYGVSATLGWKEVDGWPVLSKNAQRL